MAQTYSRHGLGWIPDLPDHRDHRYSAPLQILAALPTKVDLRPQCPPVYDQLHIGSCTANAIAGAIEFDRLKQKLQDFTPSRLFIYYNERAMEHTVNSDSGAYIRDGVKSVARLGDCPEDQWPYDGNPYPTQPGFPANERLTQRPPQSCYANALKYKAVSYQRVARTLSQMKGCLASGYPFVFGFTVYESFMSDEVARTGDAPMPASTEQVEGGHAVLAVGYDDATQRFIFRNSWNTTWGAKGYGTIPYAYLLDENLSDDFWTITVVRG
ncbi:MAG TPA: C1 family peptidase [Candidatus Binatia bacterium]|nr:C1 family peptidase [Candidatus Binatia bacterium]